jgi:uncharacterized protein
MERDWINWFEIPVSDFERAREFYNTIFEMEINPIDFGNFKMGIFPHKSSGGAICHGEWYKPGSDGPVIYLEAEPDLIHVLEKVENAGGKVLMAKKQISPEHGFMGLFLDSEGNRIGLHSSK